MLTNQDITEQVYYDRKGLRVTDKGCNARGDFYGFSRIISYELRINQPDRKEPIGLMAAGVMMLIVGIGVFLIIWGIWMWFKQKPTYWIVFETNEIKSDVVYQTNSPEEAEAIKAALDVAIANFKV